MITPEQAKAADELLAAALDNENPSEPPPNPILEALNLLHSTYPDERVDIWVSYREDGKLHYTALVQPHKTGEGDSGVWSRGYQFTAQAAADSLIREAGDRSRATRIAKRLAQLQAEIARLNAEAKETA